MCIDLIVLVFPLGLSCQMTFEGVLGLEEVALPTIVTFALLGADAATFESGEIGLLRDNNDEPRGLSNSIVCFPLLPLLLVPSCISGVWRPPALGVLRKNKGDGVLVLGLCFTVAAEIDSFLPSSEPDCVPDTGDEADRDSG